MSVTARAGLLEFCLALLRRVASPVAAVDIVGDDAVSEIAHGGKHVSACSKVRRTHVCWLLADDVDERLFDTRHLRREIACGQGAKVLRVRPRVRRDLVARLVRVLQRRLLIVDAAIERARHEEGGLGAARVECVDELLRVARWTVVVCEGDLPWRGALGNDLAVVSPSPTAWPSNNAVRD